MKLVMLRGLPASGKSTWALDYIAKTKAVRTNKDDIRALLHGDRYTGSNEKLTLKVRDAIIFAAFEAKRDVVVDDTNFNPIHEKRLREIAATWGAEFEIRDFDLDVEECIRRDLKRLNSVGAKVIRQMYNQYKQQPPPEYLPDRRWAIIVDIDGTLAKMNGRSPYDTAKCGEDLPHEHIIELVENMSDNDVDVLLVSGREEKYVDLTVAWLEKHAVMYDELFMRPTGDKRNDSIIKEEIYRNEIEGKWNIRFVIDDRDRCVALFRRLGLNVLQCNYGDF